MYRFEIPASGCEGYICIIKKSSFLNKNLTLPSYLESVQANVCDISSDGVALSAEIICPLCGSQAVNRYGKTPNGKQRYICLVCRRQFVSGARPQAGAERPTCPVCHGPMHVYMHGDHHVRYRCSAYPQCKGFVKVYQKGSDAV